MSEKWLNTVAKTGNYEDLKNKPEITSDTNLALSTTLASALAVKKVNDKIDEVNNNIKEAKGKLVEAITSKGQKSSVNDTFDSMSEKIKSIETGIQTLDATASANQILSGQTAYVNNKKVTGTMTNQGAKNSSLNAGQSYTIPEGYHNGTGKITANSLASQTQATANASQILSGATAYVNGNKITGNMPNMGLYQYAAGVGSGNDGREYIAFNRIPAGYYPENNNGWAPEIRATKSAVADHIGLTPEKIVAGISICGVVGTAQPSRVVRGTVTLANQEYKSVNLGFTPKVLLIGYVSENYQQYVLISPLLNGLITPKAHYVAYDNVPSDIYITATGFHFHLNKYNPAGLSLEYYAIG